MTSRGGGGSHDKPSLSSLGSPGDRTQILPHVLSALSCSLYVNVFRFYQYSHDVTWTDILVIAGHHPSGRIGLGKSIKAKKYIPEQTEES